jgi:hypothetical protein
MLSIAKPAPSPSGELDQSFDLPDRLVIAPHHLGVAMREDNPAQLK